MDCTEMLTHQGQEDLKKQLLLVERDSGRLLMTVCLNVTLYFKDGFEQEKRQAILDMFADYQKMMDGKLNFTTNPQTGTWKNLSKTRYPTPDTWLMDLPDQPWDFTYHGGEHHRDASDIRFNILGCAKWQQEGGDLSWVTINFPVTFFADWNETFQDVLLRWINKLQPAHGYAAISTTHNHYKDERFEPVEYSFAIEYPGLDVSHHVSHGILLKAELIKGINWITVVNQTLLDRVGGLDALKNIPNIKIWQQGDCYLIQAANAPALKSIPDSYYQLGALFKPVRIQDHYDIHDPDEHDETVFGTVEGSYQEWLNRFDKKPSE